MKQWPLSGLMILVAQAAAQSSSVLDLPSCVIDSPPMRVPADTAMATLDSADRDRFLAAAHAQFPQFKRGGGPAPRQVLLLHRDGEWLYVTTALSSAPGTCFTAVFSAGRFDFTRRLLQKYRPAAQAGIDE